MAVGRSGISVAQTSFISIQRCSAGTTDVKIVGILRRRIHDNSIYEYSFFGNGYFSIHASFAQVLSNDFRSLNTLIIAAIGQDLQSISQNTCFFEHLLGLFYIIGDTAVVLVANRVGSNGRVAGFLTQSTIQAGN